jgi:DNA-binding transcriptional MerR regulator
MSEWRASGKLLREDAVLLEAAAEANRRYHAADADRKKLMLTLSDRGFSARAIAAVVLESPNTVSYWVRTARRERMLEADAFVDTATRYD